jgi:hypothetical protein
MENYNNDQLSSIDLQVDNQVRQELTEAAKWTKFISVAMFVAAGFILLFGVLGGSLLMGVLGKMDNSFGALAEYGGGILIAIILVVVAFFTVVYYFLYRFSAKMKSAIATDNVIDMNEAFSSLKLFFIITTVVSVISLLYSVYNMFKIF